MGSFSEYVKKTMCVLFTFGQLIVDKWKKTEIDTRLRERRQTKKHLKMEVHPFGWGLERIWAC
jgi:hypothetical protein